MTKTTKCVSINWYNLLTQIVNSILNLGSLLTMFCLLGIISFKTKHKVYETIF